MRRTLPLALLTTIALASGSGCGGGGSEQAGTGGAGGTGEGGGGGGSGGTPVETACLQIPDCEYHLRAAVDSVCLPDGCVDAGLRDVESGELQRGMVHVYGRIDRMIPVSNIRSWIGRVYHPIKADGSRLGCNEILSTPGRESPLMNLVRRTTGDVGMPDEQIPTQLSQLPVNPEDVPFLAHIAFYGAGRDGMGEPQGGVLGEGCLEGLLVPPGPFAEDEAHVFLVEISPVNIATAPSDAVGY